MYKPYRFESLPRYTDAEAAVIEFFSKLLGEGFFDLHFPKVIKTVEEEILKQPIEIEFDHVRPVTLGEWGYTVPANATVARLSLAPSQAHMIWELDAVLTQSLVNRLLSGRDEEFGLMRPLGDIEQGVLTYALLKMIHACQSQSSADLALRLVEQTQDPVKLIDQMDVDSSYYLAGFKVVIGEIVSFTRFLIPAALVRQHFSNVSEEEERSSDYWRRLKENLARVGDQWLITKLRLADIDLTHEDLRTLGQGDIVLLENHDLRGSDSSLAGRVKISWGRGKNGGYEGEIIWRNGAMDLKIIDRYYEEEPGSHVQEKTPESFNSVFENGANMSNESFVDLESDASQQEIVEVEVQEGEIDDEEDTNSSAISQVNEAQLRENEGILRDVPAPVSVELARIKMNTSQVIRLKKGQILRLGRSPNDPVNLIVNDRVFARGELIEVDGELGVRLIQLAK